MAGSIIGGVIGGIGSIIGGNAQSDAIDDASDAQAAAAREATALQRQIYNQNVQYQTPYLNTGNAAMAQINALLGLQVPQSTAPAPLPATGTGGGGDWGGGSLSGPFGGPRLDAWRQRIDSGQVDINDVPPWIRAALTGAGNPANPANPAPTVPQVTQPTAEEAYNQFRNYTGYTTRLNEGQNAINSGYAANRTLQSGAALQALQEHGQNFASGEFGNYMAYLGGQQQLGPGAANALSGVGTNYANNAGNIAMQQGNNLANAAIAQANVSGNMWNGIGGALGGIAGGIFGGSSFGGGGGGSGGGNYNPAHWQGTLSERASKTDIEAIGEWGDTGLTKYRFRYKFDPSNTMVEGVMADEVEEKMPRALGRPLPNGWRTVNYAELGAA